MKKAFNNIVLFLLLTVYPIMACPNCKDAYTPGSSQASVGESYSLSILFMLSVQMLAISIVVARIVYAVKKKKRNEILA